MMDYPLLLTTFMTRTAKFFPKKEIVSVYPEENFRYTYADYYRRTCQLAHALKSLGVKKGDRVASMALNSHRHLELYFGVPCMGAALHTVNFRLPPHHLAYILNHAEDQVVFVDEDLVFFLELVKDQLKTVKHFVILSQTGKMPQTSHSPVTLYDDLIAPFPETFDWPMDLSEWDSGAHLLHLRHDRGSQGGRLQPPGHRDAHVCRLLHPRHHGERLLSPRRAHVSRQRLGGSLRLHGPGLQAGPPGAGASEHGEDLPDDRRREGYLTAGVPTIWMMLYSTWRREDGMTSPP
jgi:hypothetical protein